MLYVKGASVCLADQTGIVGVWFSPPLLFCTVPQSRGIVAVGFSPPLLFCTILQSNHKMPLFSSQIDKMPLFSSQITIQSRNATILQSNHTVPHDSPVKTHDAALFSSQITQRHTILQSTHKTPHYSPVRFRK